MHSVKKYLLAALLFVVISCSNFSNLCRHGNLGKHFGYRYGKTSPDIQFTSLERPLFTSQHQNVIPITWEHLRDVTFEIRFNKELKMDMYYPVFGNHIKKYKGKRLSISGYLIPLKPAEGLYALSAYNFASCFFCGRSGPESVISLKFKKKPRDYQTDEYLTMTGTLELNDSNHRDFAYIFRDTEEEKP